MTSPKPPGNQRLAKAIRDRGLTVAQFAKAIDVVMRTVERWIAGGSSHAVNRAKAAAYLKIPEGELFPGSGPLLGNARDEIIAAWARRSDSNPEQWWELLVAADEQISIIGYAIAHLTEQHPDFTDEVARKAAAGAKVRLVLASPTAEATRARDQEEGLHGSLVARIESSLKYLKPLRDTDVEVRLQQVPMYNSIFRYDDDMLVTPHLYATPGRLAPLLHLRRLGEKGIFDRFAQHFETIWADCVAYRDW